MTSNSAALSNRRSGNPARRAEASRLAEPDRTIDTSRAGLLRLAAIFAVALTHAYASTVVGSLYGFFAWHAALLVPAAVTLWRIPAARRTGYHRWVTVIALSQIVHIGWLIPTLVVANTWVLHRFWTVEFPPGHRNATQRGGSA